MKRAKFAWAVLAMALASGLALASCDGDLKDILKKTVASEYQFADKPWSGTGGGNATLTEDTFTVSGGTADFTLTGCYTSGGEALSLVDKWTYLYDESGKVGFIYATLLGKFLYVGKTSADRILGGDNAPSFADSVG